MFPLELINNAGKQIIKSIIEWYVYVSAIALNFVYNLPILCKKILTSQHRFVIISLIIGHYQTTYINVIKTKYKDLGKFR
jgi:hypothetical protein